MKRSTEFDGELREGWVYTTVKDISVNIQYGYTASASNKPHGPRFLRITDIQEGNVEWNQVPSCEIDGKNIPKYELCCGDIVFARTGATTGKSFLITSCPLAIFASYLIRLRPNEAIESRYLSAFFQTSEYWQMISENVSGNAQPNCNASKLASLQIPLPPLAEQKRIIAKVEELLVRVNAARARLKKIPIILKRFRQSVLAAACSGQLTAEWREKNGSIDTGADLLAQIRSKRLTLADSKKETEAIQAAFASDSFAVSDSELEIDASPDSWTRCRIGAIGTVCNGSTPSRKNPEFWNGDIPWVSSGEVRNNVISSTREQITEQGFQNSSVRLLPCGTVLLAMIGEGKTRGQTAVLNIEATINQNIAAIIVKHGLISSVFLWRWFQMQYEWTREQGGGSGPQALNCQRVRELPFVLPPLTEQNEIALRVDALFALADKIEARVQTATAGVEKITRAILAKAFRGELVPTEAELARLEERDYETAGQLLARIKACSAAKETAVKQSRTRRKKSGDAAKNHRPKMRA